MSMPLLTWLTVSVMWAARNQSDMTMFLKPQSRLSVSLSSRSFAHAHWPLRRLYEDITQPTFASLTAASNCGGETSRSVRWATTEVSKWRAPSETEARGAPPGAGGAPLGAAPPLLFGA